EDSRDLYEKLLGMADRNRRREQEIRSLEHSLERLRTRTFTDVSEVEESNKRLTAELAEARKKISATEKHLNLLRQSHTMKLGRALITPLTLFRRIRTSSRRDKASVKSEHPSQNPPMDVIKGQSSTERQATKGVRKQPSEMTLEELRHAFKADPSSSGLYNLL